MSPIHSGGCLCGAVRFEVEGDFDAFFLCHCSRCRKATGSAHASNLFSGSAELRWLKGEDSVSVYLLPETRFGKAFCKTCGSALPRLQPSGTLLVPAGSLETPVPNVPDAHIFFADRGNWDEDLHTLAHHDKRPG